MDPVRVAYVVGFGLAGVACLASLRQLSTVVSPDTRRGLAGLLVLSGLWALTSAGRYAFADDGVQVALYTIGLVVGLGTVWAWLYFCSAYTGHDYHHRTTLRQVGLGLYLAIVSLKLTNPVHEMYFTTTTTAQPFSHVVIQLSTVHWVVTGLAYALSAVGFYLLYEMLSESNSNVRSLGALVAATGLPIVFYLISLGDTPLLTLHYEPIGVAIFAVGVLYGIDEQFVAVPQFWRNQIVDEISEAVVLIDSDRVVRDYNTAAVETFPALAGAKRRPLAAVVPELATVLDDEDNVIAIDVDGVTRYYLVDDTPLESGALEVGRGLVCTDVTEVERQRRELQRQNEQFDDFAAAITHELRNTLTIADGYLELVTDELGDDNPSDVDAVRRMQTSLDRMDRIVGDLSTLARYGQTVDEIGECDLGEAARTAYDEVGFEETSLVVEREATVAADRPRLVELFRAVFNFARHRDATGLRIVPEENGFAVTVDCDPLSPGEIDGAFDYGQAVPSAETGMLFPTIQTIGRVHGWTVAIDPDYREGVRLTVRGVSVADSGAPSAPA